LPARSGKYCNGCGHHQPGPSRGPPCLHCLTGLPVTTRSALRLVESCAGSNPRSDSAAVHPMHACMRLPADRASSQSAERRRENSLFAKVAPRALPHAERGDVQRSRRPRIAPRSTPPAACGILVGYASGPRARELDNGRSSKFGICLFASQTVPPWPVAASLSSGTPQR
jgi:hypothetical protein